MINRSIALVAALAYFLTTGPHVGAAPIIPDSIAPGGNPFSSVGGVDPNYNFIYQSMDILATGTFSTLSPSGLGNGSEWVFSGAVSVVGTGASAGITGNYTLYHPIGPGETTSPDGLYFVDNALYPSKNAASGVNPNIGAGPSYLTNWGLYFVRTSVNGSASLNIYANGNGDYALLVNSGIGYIGDNSGGMFTITDPPAAPEPATLTMGLLGLAGFAVSRLRRQKISTFA